MTKFSGVSLPYRIIKGQLRLKHYLGPYNKSKGKIYNWAKIQTTLEFKLLKDNIVEWLQSELHWIKEDYIQAQRISNIGLLAYTYFCCGHERKSTSP